MPDIRDVALRDVWGRNAQTTIPAPPVSGVAYRNANVADFGEGQRFDAVFDSARWNQLLYETTSIVRLAEQYGGIPWSPLTAYPIGSRAMGGNGEIYQAIRASTPASPQNPIGASTYWASIKTDPAIATTTTSGIARQATEAEALAGTVGGAVFLPPDKSKRSRYYGGAIQALNSTSPSGSNFFVPTNGTLTLEDAIEIGKYFWVAAEGEFSIQPGPTMNVLIRGGMRGSNHGAGGLTPVATTGCWGLLVKTSAATWFYFVTPDVDNAISARLTPGEIRYFAMATPPTGYLKANGAALSRTTYAALFAAIGTTYGAGNGSTTFNVPDLRGEFVRGWDDGRGIDAGRALGSAQSDAIRNITGGVVGTYSNGSQGTGATGAFAYEAQGGYIEAGAGSRENYVSFNASRVVPTAAENRPRNVALLACIKY